MAQANWYKLILISWAIAIAISACSHPEIANPNLTLGNPSQATTSLTNSNNYLMVKPQYVLSYSKEKATANWVSWQLNWNWLGQQQRQDNFRPDPALPVGWYAVNSNDYLGTKRIFARGHIIPSADRTKTIADNSATFLMTNIIPQAHANNDGPWLQLEQYARSLVKEGKELYIVAGGIGNQTTIGNGKIIAPERVWKVIVVVDRSGQGLSGINFNTRVIAVDIPNKSTVATNWRSYITSVNKLQAATGYDFLSNVPIWLQVWLEAKVDGANYFDPDWRFLIFIIGIAASIILLVLFAISKLKRSSSSTGFLSTTPKVRSTSEPKTKSDHDSHPNSRGWKSFQRLETHIQNKESKIAGTPSIDEPNSEDLEADIQWLRSQISETKKSDNEPEDII